MKSFLIVCEIQHWSIFSESFNFWVLIFLSEHMSSVLDDHNSSGTSSNGCDQPQDILENLNPPAAWLSSPMFRRTSFLQNRSPRVLHVSVFMSALQMSVFMSALSGHSTQSKLICMQYCMVDMMVTWDFIYGCICVCVCVWLEITHSVPKPMNTNFCKVC